MKQKIKYTLLYKDLRILKMVQLTRLSRIIRFDDVCKG